MSGYARSTYAATLLAAGEIDAGQEPVRTPPELPI